MPIEDTLPPGVVPGVLGPPAAGEPLPSFRGVPKETDCGLPCLTPEDPENTPATPNTPIQGTCAVAVEPGMSVVGFDKAYPDARDAKKRDEAYMHVLRGASLEDTAKLVGVEKQTALYWAYTGKWLESRAHLLAVEEAEENQELVRLRLEKRRKLLKRQVETADKVLDHADSLLESGDLTPGNLKQVAEAINTSGSTAARALGVGESGATVSQMMAVEKEKAKAAGKEPLVVVFQNGGLPPVRVPGRTLEGETV